MTSEFFTTQPLAFPDLDVFEQRKTPAQQASIYAQALDVGFTRQMSKDPLLNPQSRVALYFPPKDMTYLQGPARPPEALKISVNGLSSYQQNNSVNTPHDNYMKVMLENGGVGKEQAQYIAQIIRASFAIAARASEGQLEREKIGTGKYPGVLKTAFPTQVQDPRAAQMVGVLGKFIEPQLLRESLLEYRAGFASTLKGTQMGQMLLDEVSPGNNIAQELVQVVGRTEGDAIQRKTMAERIRFQRMMPHYSQLGSTTQHIIRKVKAQQTMLGKFRPRPSGRFLFDD